MMSVNKLLPSSLFRIRSTLAAPKNSTVRTRQVVLSRCSTKNSLNVRNIRSIAAVCIRVHTAGRKLNGFKKSCQLSGIKPVLDKVQLLRSI